MKIFEKSRTTDSDILKIAKEMGVKLDQVDWKQNLNLHCDYAVLNMGTPSIGGTHWCAVSNKDKSYFDPLGLPRPRVIPSDYNYREVDIQDLRYGHCGQYALLWLWAIQHNQLDKFYKMFKLY